MRRGQPSRTAMVVAFWRSLGDLGVTNLPNFSDPFARRLLAGPLWGLLLRRAGALMRDPERAQARAGMADHIDGVLLRVVFIDAVLASSSARQVVIVGAGLDTRAWRLDALRGVQVFEVDHPTTQAYKREHVPLLGEPLARLTFVPVDFTVDDFEGALQAAGHDASQPTVWVWEGVTMYLGDDALRSTLQAIRRRSAEGSTLIAHYHEPDATRSSSTIRQVLFSWIGEPQIGLRTRQMMHDEVTRAGFRVVEDAGLAEQAQRAGIPTPQSSRLRVSRILVAT